MDAKHAQGEPRILISRSSLLHNANLIRRAVADRVRICAIVKADAYGHGSGVVADTLCNFSTDSSLRPAVEALAVASIDEAAALPETHGVSVIVLRPVENVFIGRQRARLEEAIHHGWVLTVCTPSAADDINRVAMACQKRASVQVMVDTGMTRSGVETDLLADLLHRVESRPALRLTGLCTHFANADREDDPFTAEQLARFREATDEIASALPGRFLRHAANSGALFSSPQSHLDMVRPGISLYGIDPTGRPRMSRKLRPVMKWVAPLVSVQTVRKGTSVGYGQSWVAPRDTRIGVVPVGYADGYPRNFGGHAAMVIAGRKAPVVGRVSMDLTTIDLGDTTAQVGDEATLMDSDPLSPVSVYELAKWGQTIPYEIFCRIGPRMPRVVVDADDVPIDGAAKSPGVVGPSR